MVAMVGPPLCLTWSVFDWVLDRSDFSRFLLIRVAIAVSVLTLFQLQRRCERLETQRRLTTMMMLCFQGGIACMLPSVTGDAYAFYVLGFSVGGWAGGGTFTFPVRYVLTYSLGSTAVWFAGELLVGHHTPIQILASGFYMISVAILSAAMVYTRRVMTRRLFEARHEAQQRNAELSLAMKHLKEAEARLVESEKLSALGRLLAGLSHEINNPTNVIRNNLGPVAKYWGSARAVLERARRGSFEPGELDALWEEHDLDFALTDHDDAIKAMLTATDRVGAVHASLRAFVRGDVAERVDTDVNDGLRATVHLIRRNLPPGVHVHESYADRATVSANPGEVNQVFFNLIQNAVDAVDGRGVVRIETRGVGEEVEVSVVDDGPGVGEAAAARLFERFFTTKGVGKGTGLGLATSRQIIARHGGTLRLDATHSPGARFVVRLPAAAPAPAVPEPE